MHGSNIVAIYLLIPSLYSHLFPNVFGEKQDTDCEIIILMFKLLLQIMNVCEQQTCFFLFLSNSQIFAYTFMPTEIIWGMLISAIGFNIYSYYFSQLNLVMVQDFHDQMMYERCLLSNIET